MDLIGQFPWLSLLPPIIAIALALITKEVYFSLFLGILSGAMIVANLNPITAAETIFGTMAEKLASAWNVNILLFLVMLGMVVALVTKAGGSAAYGKWASARIKSKRGASLATVALGALIFIDDYFNCLTVGSVMRPVTDKYKISRAKLSYLIDATAAPVCIIAPISSWAAAVSSSLPEGSTIDGFQMFLNTIPFNLYAILTIAMILIVAISGKDFGLMKKHELNAANGDLFTTEDRPYGDETEVPAAKGRVFDLVLPIIVLIVACIAGMVYTGGFFSGVDFITAFRDCDASVGLVLGSLATLVFMFVLYLPRKVITFKEFSESIVSGFRAMVPAIAILVFAWTLSGITSDSLGLAEYVGGLIGGSAGANFILPVVMFLVALFLAFSTGTSWGTFSILVPIVVTVFPEMSTALTISVSAVLAGAVCGDHISPISDTTIMASAGAQSNHINHVSTQMPYALLVAGCCVVGYLVAGLTNSVWLTLLAGFAALAIALTIAFKVGAKKAK